MNGNDRSRLRDENNRERFALRRAERRMDAGAKALEHELEAFGAHLEQVELRIEANVREEHWGHDPERPLSWTVYPPPDQQ
jgi:hypothetical protein